MINNSDIADNHALFLEEILQMASGIPGILVSAISGEGFNRLEPCLTPGTTIVIIGSSGVGKSTLINRLLGQPLQKRGGTRENAGKGRHTTTPRQLFILNSGALMIDNPGLRELGIGPSSTGIVETFSDIHELAEGCRFSDCRHEQEPCYAVEEAISGGSSRHPCGRVITGLGGSWQSSRKNQRSNGSGLIAKSGRR